MTATFHPLPEPDLSINNTQDTIFCFEDGDILLLNPGEFTAYLWEGPGIDNLTMPIANVSQEGSYGVTVWNEFGCQETDTIFVDEICPARLFFPNAFTPNGDGLNDTFHPKGKWFTNFFMVVYNRWGEIIFKTNDYRTGWDGKYRGELMPSGSYAFICKYKPELPDEAAVEFVGNVTLIR